MSPFHLFQSNVNSDDEYCSGWKDWSSVANVSPSNTVGTYIFNYLIYVVLAVFMSTFAGLYVIALAPYAAGSGIPEVVGVGVGGGEEDGELSCCKARALAVRELRREGKVYPQWARACWL